MGITCNIFIGTYTDSIVWKTSDSSVATVDEKGCVTGVSGGTAEITAQSNVTQKSSKCSVTVISNDLIIDDNSNNNNNNNNSNDAVVKNGLILDSDNQWRYYADNLIFIFE